MTREERDELMKYSGMIKGICMMLLPDDSPYTEEEDDTAHVKQLLTDISNDMEFLAKGADVFVGTTGPAIDLEGSDVNDV